MATQKTLDTVHRLESFAQEMDDVRNVNVAANSDPARTYTVEYNYGGVIEAVKIGDEGEVVETWITTLGDPANHLAILADSLAQPE